MDTSLTEEHFFVINLTLCENEKFLLSNRIMTLCFVARLLIISNVSN